MRERALEMRHISKFLNKAQGLENFLASHMSMKSEPFSKNRYQQATPWARLVIVSSPFFEGFSAGTLWAHDFT
jgi:hypothetical protein